MRSDNSVEDPGFASAIEAEYLSALALRVDQGQSVEGMHRDLLDQAIYEADPTNGGLRFKNLANAAELERRLFRVLEARLKA